MPKTRNPLLAEISLSLRSLDQIILQHLSLLRLQLLQSADVVEVDSFSLEAYAERALEPTVPMGLRRVGDDSRPAPAEPAQAGGTSGDETSAA